MLGFLVRIRLTIFSPGLVCAAIAALIGAPALSAQAGLSTIFTGFSTGETYKSQDRDTREAYIVGVNDALRVAGMFDAPERRPRWLRDCTVGWKVPQLTAIADRYVAAHPERWQDPMAVLYIVAMREACPGWRLGTPNP